MELHSPPAEENCMTENAASLRSAEVAVLLVSLKPLSLWELGLDDANADISPLSQYGMLLETVGLNWPKEKDSGLGTIGIRGVVRRTLPIIPCFR